MEELIIRSLQGEATQAEELDLHQWRSATVENEQEYASVVQLWNLTGRVAPRGTETRPPSARQLLSRSSSRAELRRHSRPEDARSGWLPRVAAAASLVLLSLSVGWILATERAAPPLAVTEFVTGSSEMVATRLSDGSVVRLAPQSRLRVTDSRDAREIWLEGQAFFAVARDEGRPFVVRTPAGEAKVLGTRFDVKSAAGDLRVMVVEGRVAVESDGHRIEVAAGELSRMAEGEPPYIEKVDDVHALLAWMGRFLVFEETPLREVVKEIEQRYKIQIAMADSSLAERTVTAWFTEQNAEEVLMVICRIIDARCSIREGIATIAP